MDEHIERSKYICDLNVSLPYQIINYYLCSETIELNVPVAVKTELQNIAQILEELRFMTVQSNFIVPEHTHFLKDENGSQVEKSQSWIARFNIGSVKENTYSTIEIDRSLEHILNYPKDFKKRYAKIN